MRLLLLFLPAVVFAGPVEFEEEKDATRKAYYAALLSYEVELRCNDDPFAVFDYRFAGYQFTIECEMRSEWLEVLENR